MAVLWPCLGLIPGICWLISQSGHKLSPALTLSTSLLYQPTDHWWPVDAKVKTCYVIPWPAASWQVCPHSTSLWGVAVPFCDMPCCAVLYITVLFPPRQMEWYWPMPCRAVPCHAIHYAGPGRTIRCRAVPCHAVLSHDMLCCAVPYSAVPCHAIHYAGPGRAIQCHPVPCHAVLCRAIQCRPVPCHAMLSHDMMCRAIQCRPVPCTMLAQAVPYSAVLSHAMLSCAIQCRPVPCHAVLSRAMPYTLLARAVPYSAVLSHTMPCCPVLYHTVPCSPIPSRAVPCCTIQCRALPCHAVLSRAMPYTLLVRAVPYSAVLSHAMPCCPVLYHTVPCSPIPSRTLPYLATDGCNHSSPHIDVWQWADYGHKSFFIHLIIHWSTAAPHPPTHPPWHFNQCDKQQRTSHTLLRMNGKMIKDWIDKNNIRLAWVSLVIPLWLKFYISWLSPKSRFKRESNSSEEGNPRKE